MVSPYVCRLHSGVAILAVCDCVARQALHERHFPQAASGVFDKEEPGFQLTNEFENVGVYLVAESGIIAHRVQIPCLRILPPVVADGRN